MTFSSINPGPPLQPFVRDYLMGHFIFDNNKPVPVKPYAPKPEQGITFFVKGGATMVSSETGNKEAPPVSIFGQQITRCNIHLTAEFLVFRVHFKPGVLFRLLEIPVVEFRGAYFKAELVLDRKAPEVNEQSAGARGYPEMVEKAIPAGHPIDGVVTCLTSDPPGFSPARLVSEACLNPAAV